MDGLDRWTITAYPQLLEIKPIYSGGAISGLKFSVPAPNKFNDIAGSGGLLSSLSVVDANGNDTSRPQQFIIDWSTGFLSPQRYLPMPCVSCQLVLHGTGKLPH
jgi:hypothetical protein